MKTDCTERRTVLVVDDDEMMLNLLIDLLRQEGYDVASARDGSHALEVIRSFEPEIVISDVVMPIMDGIELCRRLKHDPRTANVPVLLISGIRLSDDDTLEGLTAGADDYLGIPFRHEELLVKVARLAERHRVERHYREQSESYRELFENANDIIYTHDLEGNFTSLNMAGERITGYTREEAMRMKISDVLAPESLTLARQMMTRKTIERGAS